MRADTPYWDLGDPRRAEEVVMSLTTRMVAQVLSDLLTNREDAMRDPKVLAMVVRERARLARELRASAPRLPRMSPADLLLLRALDELYDEPVATIIDGPERPGSIVRAARMRLVDGRPVVETGRAIVDDWGRPDFTNASKPLATPAPAPK